MSFVHLHNHTHYSLLDGLTRPKDAIKIAKAQGSPAIAMTDHGVMYGAVEFYKAGKEEGINPIIGCEIYVAPQGMLKKEANTPICHLTLLAETTEGYHNLIELVTRANLEGFYYKPRVDHSLLKHFGKGLIALSGCLASESSQAVLDGNMDKAVEAIHRYQDIFGSENFFLEVQDHPELAEQIIVNNAMYELANRLKVPLVATNDNHYGRKEDKDVHDILLCIQTGKTVGETNRMKYEGDFWIRDPQDMIQVFKDHPEAITNTLEIAKRCNVEIKFGKNLIPQFHPPYNVKQTDYLRELCDKGMTERYGETPDQVAKDRLDYELQVIHDSGFDNYFLIVHDFVKYAKESGVIVGPGRGSAAGSLVAYVLHITDIDPLPYGLLFERFLNPARVSMPDIDIDFDDERRGDVLQYVVEKYGRNNVAQIITFGTMAARAAVRDVGRAMGYPYSEVDKIAKMVPPPIQGKHIPLLKSVQEDQMLKHLYDTDERAKQLLEKAIRLEGTVRHAGTHACAVVLSEEPLTQYTPLQRATGDGDGVITQFSMKPLEELGLLKVDFLGLKNLTIIREALIIIKRTKEVDIVLTKLPLDDKKSFELLAKGETTGVFQLESAGMRRYLKQLKPTEFNDIIAMVSLYRPGPMPWIPMYIKGKHDPKSVKYLHPTFEQILKETYGVAVYQEQILFIARQFAGFSLGEADILRKAVGKKDPKLLAGEQEKFINGAVQKGYKKSFAEDVFEKVIKPFAAYGFNKSHATCYAMIAYQTAYLKAHYPAEFMAALMTADADNEDRIALEANECRAMGIDVLPPSINQSLDNFTVVDDKTIRFGLSAIKGLGTQPIAAIIAAREKKGSFTNIADVFSRVPSEVVNKKVVEALGLSGAFDDIAERNQIVQSVDEILAFARSHKTKAVDDSQTDIFGLMTAEDSSSAAMHLNLKKTKPATKIEKLRWEKQLLGLFVSGHPLQGLKKYLTKKAFPIGTLTAKYLGKKVKLCGIIAQSKRVVTKTGLSMAYIVLEDLTGRIEMIAFPKTYQAYAQYMDEGMVVLLEGTYDKRSGQPQVILDSIKEVSLDSMIANAQKDGLFDENEKFVAVVQVQEEEDIVEAKPVDDTYTINLTDKMESAGMEYLKKLLAANKGDRKVIINLSIKGKKQQILLPFGIELTPELKQQIGEIAK
ncbi:DNA polymerase III subunit alpha [Candidatus Gracilibacteria bacterium]|nr:DNA polymerase III subunit alpha [Candidatus Gracilibacteria bacterium]